MSKIPKILISAPHADVKNYSIHQWINFTKHLIYPNYDLLIVDNSITTDNQKMFESMGIECIWINPKNKERQQVVAESHEMIRTTALKRGYDAVFHLETDIIPNDIDILHKLLIQKKDVIGAVYQVGFGQDRELMIHSIDSNGNMRNVYPSGLDFSILDGLLHKVYGAGLGCILIKRNVLKKFSFRYEKGAKYYPDSFFYADMHRLKIPIYLDTMLFCEHYNSPYAHHLNFTKDGK